MNKNKNWVRMLAMATLVLGFYACSNDLEEDFSISSSEAGMLKSTVTGRVDSLMFSRHPGGGSGLYRMYGIKITDDTWSELTDIISTGSSLGYQLYFYNEMVYTSDDATTGVGCPAIFMGAGVTGYKTNFTGRSALEMLTWSDVSGTLASDASATLPLPSGSPYRYSTGGLIKSYVKTSYYPTFLIGNSFQGVASASQPIYVIKVTIDEDEYYYAFMISRFKNGSTTTGDPGTDIYYMTISYKLLYY
jgi:hypothetical protein